MHFLKLFVAGIISLAAYSAHADNSCFVSTKIRLAMDQRDDLRMQCLKHKAPKLNVASCLNIANAMEYSTNAEEARLFCLSSIKQISIKECFTIAKSMEYPDTGDEVRWDCLRRFNKTLNKKQCRSFARNMSYPANSQRASTFCSQELD